jgi:hypothetical protein
MHLTGAIVLLVELVGSWRCREKMSSIALRDDPKRNRGRISSKEKLP